MKYRNDVYSLLILAIGLISCAGNTSKTSSTHSTPCLLTPVIDQSQPEADKPSDACAPAASKKQVLPWMDEIERRYPCSNSLKCWFEYDTKVNGYLVRGRFCPSNNDCDCEVGYFVLSFTNPKHTLYADLSEYGRHTCTETLRIKYSESFSGWKTDSLYRFHYDSPSEDENFDRNHPLGYSCPFQFYDIDFDGQKELMISDNSGIQGGNFYFTYRIEGSDLTRIESLPITEIQTYSEINPSKRQITISGCDGAPVWYKLHFIKGRPSIADIKFPEYPCYCGDSIYREYIMSWRDNEFFLDSFEVFNIDTLFRLKYADGVYQVVEN